MLVMNMLRHYIDIMYAREILFLVITLLTGCADEEQLQQEPEEPVAVSLSFAVSSANKQDITRQSDAVVQEGSARTIQILHIIPFATTGKVQKTDMPMFGSFGARDNTISRYFYYENCSFISGVNAFLVYGKAEPATGDAVNGALNAKIPADMLPAGITFSPKQIRNTEAIHSDAQAIATYLTTIANTTGWSTTTNSRLQAFYQNFIGQGNLAPTVIAGSSASVKAYVTHLKKLIEAEPESSLRTAILTNIDFANIATHIPTGFPGSIDLPDGAAALRWEIPAGKTEYAFVPQTVTTTEAIINSMKRFAYPAELYYYGNSRICTSTIDDRKRYYDNTSWGTSKNDANTVLNGFEYDPGTVSPNTKAIAIKEPVQYAVARLDAKIKASATILKDANNNNVEVGSKSFPLTGIVVGAQRPVGFDFAPVDNNDENVYFVYDSQVNTNTNDTYFYLSLEERGPVRTLLLQSYDGENVTIVLEFENNSDTDFVGVDGIVYRGTKFYLVGELKLEEATGDEKVRVFTQDQTTTATLTVNGLTKAYNVMPDLLSPQLEIGVTLTRPWTGSTPTTVILE